MRPENPSEPEFLRTDARQRRNIALLMAAMIVFAIAFFFFGLPALNAWVQAGSTAAALHKFALVCYAIAALLLIAAGWVAVYARRVLRSGQFPPPGTWVFNDTPLRRGAAARIRAQGTLVVALCLVLFAAYAIVLPHWLHARLLPPVPTSGAPLQPIR